MRTVQVDLSSDSINVTKFFGGYQGEHNATLLKIKLPARMLNANRDPSDQIDQYRFDFGVSTGANVQGAAIAAGDVTGDTVENYLPQGVMFAPVLSVCVCAYRYDASDPPKPELVEKSSAVDLLIKNPVAGSEDATIVDPFGPGPGATVDQELDPDSTNPIANKPVAEAIAAVPLKAGTAEASAQNTLSSAGCLGFYFKDTSVVGTTFTCTLVDKDGNDAPLPAMGDLNGDGSVDLFDLDYLTRHFTDPAAYPLKQDANFTGWDSDADDYTYTPDTRVDEYDQTYLLNYIDFPGDYPLPTGALISCDAGVSWNFCGRITAMSGATITVELGQTPPAEWSPSTHEYNAGDLSLSGYIWLPFAPQAGTVPIGPGALSVGVQNAANEYGSATTGYNNTADGRCAFASGSENVVGFCGHAEGTKNQAKGKCSHVEGEDNTATGDHQHVQGKHNYELGANYVDIVGWGSSSSSKKNVSVLDKDGNLYLTGRVRVGATGSDGISQALDVPAVCVGSSDPPSPPTSIGDMLILGRLVFVAVNDGGLHWEPVFDNSSLSFGEIQSLVRYGLAPRVFRPHVDTIRVRKGSDTIVFDILGHDIDTPTDNTKTHSMTIMSHDCVLNNYAFGEKEALFYFANGLSAGTYNFTVKRNQFYTSDVNKTFEFTLTSDVPAGGQLVSTRSANAGFAGTSLKSYASGSSTTEIETATVTEGSSGTSLGNVGETITATNNLIYRTALFNNEYRTSPLRQLINSTAAAGSVWSPAGSFDRPPTWASTADGWLKNVDASFVSVLGNVKKKTMLPQANGNTLLETDEKVFLLSRTEIYGGDESSGNAEGSSYPYFSQYSDLSSAGTGEDSNRVKSYSGTAKTWWLRTARVENPNVYSTRYVKDNGGITFSYTDDKRAVVVACCIV